MIKLNGKEGRFTGIFVQKKAAGFSSSGSDHIKYFNLGEINQIQVSKAGWVLTDSFNQGKIAFVKDLDISKIISLFSVYFVYDRKNNDRVEITRMEKKYITTLMIMPIIEVSIGGAWVLINPKPIYKLPIFLNKNRRDFYF